MHQTELEVLPAEVCAELLRSHSIGRIAIVSDGFPAVFPINYRTIGSPAVESIVFRTAPGNVIDRAPAKVGFEIDGVDPIRRLGWSVLVSGLLRHVDEDMVSSLRTHDPDPFRPGDTSSWLVLIPVTITGRRLPASDIEWAFHIKAYL